MVTRSGRDRLTLRKCKSCRDQVAAMAMRQLLRISAAHNARRSANIQEDEREKAKFFKFCHNLTLPDRINNVAIVRSNLEKHLENNVLGHLN
jgi:hypothetical protein